MLTGLVPHGLFILLSYDTQDHPLRSGTTPPVGEALCSQLAIRKISHRLVYRQCDRRIFLS